MEQQINEKIVEFQNVIGKFIEEKNKEMIQKDEEIVGLRNKNVKLVGEICELKEKVEKIEAYMKKKKISIPCRVLPTELLNELFGSLPFQNAFGLLAIMPNGLLARNVQKMTNCIKEAIKNNELNKEDCCPKLAVFEDRFVLKHSGTDGGRNCVRALLPIPILNLKFINKSLIAFYFEMEIINKTLRTREILNIYIGICDQLFPLEGNVSNVIGCKNCSIGICKKRGIRIDSFWARFQNDRGNFKENVIGLGLIYHPNSEMECFATMNGQFKGKYKLPAKFATIQLFPAVSLYDVGETIQVNFGKEEWKFKEFGCVLE